MTTTNEQMVELGAKVLEELVKLRSYARRAGALLSAAVGGGALSTPVNLIGSQHYPSLDYLETNTRQPRASELSALRAAASALIDKLDAVTPFIHADAAFMAARGVEYTGPTFGEELEALRSMLAGHPVESEAAQQDQPHDR